MRRPLAFVILAALSPLACSKEEPPPKETTAAPKASAVTPPPSSAPAAPVPSAKAPPTLAERIKCEKLFPDSALLTFAAGYKVTQQPAAQVTCPECGPACNLLKAGKPFEGAHVAYTCNVPFTKEAAEATLAPLKKDLRKSQPVKGFGRGGVHGEKDNGTFYSAVVFDEDTDCSVTVDWMRGTKDDTLALARTALAAIKPADLK